jgi:sugar (pentulose or hexulose) kinase
MDRPSTIAVFDIGRTNRKLVVFDEMCRVLDIRFLDADERIENGRTSLNLTRLRSQIESATRDLIADPRWALKAVDFTAYGATMVWLGADGEPVHPVVDYMDPFPEDCRDAFEREHGPIPDVCMRTASPWLGNLNSGLQLYALKKTDPQRFSRIRHAVHLPQYLSSFLTGRLFSETTGIGCHTLTWDFGEGRYADWVRREGIDALFPALRKAEEPVEVRVGDSRLLVGIGLHDSSSALIPYLYAVPGPFLLLSTGTWSICLNPFDGGVLTQDELEADCLDYLRYDGGAVKASRLPLGIEHDAVVESLCRLHDVSPSFFHDMPWNDDAFTLADDRYREGSYGAEGYDPSNWRGLVEAYHALIYRLTMRQRDQVRRVLSPGIGSLYVDGGFSGNRIFLRMLSRALPDLKVFASEVGQSTALGAAVVMHSHWNTSASSDGLVSFMPVVG